MLYLRTFKLLNDDKELGILKFKKNIYNTIYPLRIFPKKEFEDIYFEPITIFYGGNGTGKSTLLKIISQKLNAINYIDSNNDLFNEYVRLTKSELIRMSQCKEIKFITSDDVFDILLDIRAINSNINRRKDELSEEYIHMKYENSNNISIFDYENVKKSYDAKRMTVSKYTRTNLANNNIIEHSNGESALAFWEKEINENGIYILDEPENSLSAENQLKLKQFIEDSARFYNCQFIISTHSPFILSLDGAKVYDLDSVPVEARSWTELPNIKTYYNFFKEYKYKFENDSNHNFSKRISLTNKD